MKRIMFVISFMFIFPALAFAQSSDDKRGWLYAFGAIGGSSGSFGTTRAHFGGGGEALVAKGFGVGAEVGYNAPTRSLGDGFGIFSVNGAYHFVESGSRQKVVPFVTGGVSLAFRGDASGGGNFGGGIQYWGNDSVGLRLEFRDHIFSSDSPHFYTFRAGITFR